MNEEKNELPARAPSILNRSSIKKYALLVSTQRRGGKFTRVGESFFEQVEAELEAVIRKIGIVPTNSLGALVMADPDAWFITGLATKKVEEQLNEAARRIIQSLVMQQPSIGCTLKF
jgi:sarcosine oxidase gamma subunit